MSDETPTPPKPSSPAVAAKGSKKPQPKPPAAPKAPPAKTSKVPEDRVPEYLTSEATEDFTTRAMREAGWN